MRNILTIEAPREILWIALTDYESFTNIYGGINSIDVLFKDSTCARVQIYQAVILKRFGSFFKEIMSRCDTG